MAVAGADMMRCPKPQAIVIAQVCSICGLPWDHHSPDATIEECVLLLRNALEDARKWRPARLAGDYVTTRQQPPPAFSPNICGGGS